LVHSYFESLKNEGAAGMVKAAKPAKAAQTGKVAEVNVCFAF
jgi:hypothetical protein